MDNVYTRVNCHSFTLFDAGASAARAPPWPRRSSKSPRGLLDSGAMESSRPRRAPAYPWCVLLAVVPAARPARTEWKFGGAVAPRVPEKLAVTLGWEALSGVSGLSVHDGRLTGKTTADFPTIHLERTSGLDSRDLLHSMEIRLRVSAGANLFIHFVRGEKVDLAKELEDARAF